MSPSVIPPWAHLSMTEAELTYHLDRSGMPDEKINSIIHQHFKSDFINRFFLKTT